MQDCDNISPYLLSAGVTELDRALKMLQPESISIMHLGVEEWIEFTHSFAKHINYYTADTETPSGDWQAFYEKALALKSEIATYDKGEIPAHLTLLVAFLNLLEYPRESINGITKRHLDFYYRDVLQLQNRAFEADQVYTVYELNKSTEEFLLEKNTLLNGGKDSEGNVQHYAVEEDIVLSKATITNYKTIYTGQNNVYKTATDEVTAINGEYPFGYGSAAEFGFSIASSTLFLKEGSRKIKIRITCNRNISLTWSSLVSIYFSTDKGWVKKTTSSLPGDSFLNESKNNNDLLFMFALGEDDEPLVAPTMELHGRTGNVPVVKFLFDAPSSFKNAFLVWRDIELQTIKIDTETVYSESLKIKTDQGFVDTKNEFFPFGAVPKKGSVLKVHADELVGKYVTGADVQIIWKDRPDDFRDVYKAYYQRYYDNDFSPTTFTTASPPSIITDANGTNRFTVSSHDNSESLFGTGNKKFSHFDFPTLYDPTSSNHYPINLTLQNDFAHKEYGIITAVAVSIKGTIDSAWPKDTTSTVPLLPQPPYTPLAESISLTARTTASLTVSQKGVQLSWELPFGYHPFAGLQKNFLPPLLSNSGELYLSIENEKPNQLFQILIALEEGTENPDREVTAEQREIKWSYLDGDTWRPLTTLEILKNETDNFLKSGLFQFRIPTYDANHHILPMGKLWIKARLNNYWDAVSKVQGFHAQAVRASFTNIGNSLSHLPVGIEAETISKLVNRKAQIKKIIQPYASYGGKAEEEDANYYTRVSERLRHKNRAVSTWDCDHLLLEKFDFIHKVKTINHSVKENYIQPGEVLIVAVPSMQNQKVYNVLQPKISQAKLNELAAFINERNSLHVEAKVMSPTYLPVRILASIKYYEGYDASFYEKQLKEDITAYLAPWTTQGENAIQFGGQLFYSQVVFFIEQLPYVDFLKELRIMVNGGTVKNLEAADPMTIVTSVPAAQHSFTTINQSICTA